MEKIIELQEFLNAILKNAKNSKSLLTYQNVIDIKKIVDELKKLEERNITSKNFIHKVNSFKKSLKNMEEEFGYKPRNNDLPFNRPTDLKIKLDNLLVSYGLSDEEIRDLTKELLGIGIDKDDKTRRQKEKKIKPILSVATNENGKIVIKQNVKYIAPLAKKEHYSQFKSSDDDYASLTIEMTRGELNELQEYVMSKFQDYYCGSAELYIKDIIKTIITNQQN